GPEAGRIAAHRARQGGRDPRQLARERARARVPAGPQVHLVPRPPALAVLVGLKRDAVVGLPHPDLVGGATAQLDALGAGALAGQLELEVGDRAVERVVLRPPGVGVDPGDEVARLARHSAPHAHPLAAELELAGGGALAD